MSLSYLLPRPTRETDTSSRGDFGSRPLSALYRDVSLLAQVSPQLFALSNFDSQSALSPIIELRSAGRLTHTEKEKWANAPVNLRDERAVAWAGNAVERYANGELVRFEDCAEALGTLEAADEVSACMDRARERAERARRRALTRNADAGNPAATPFALSSFVTQDEGDVLNVNTLMLLESLHRSLTLYLWLSFRFPLAFCFRADVEERKLRTEAAIEFGLDAIRMQRAQRLTRLGRGSEVRREHQRAAESVEV